jgi:NADPH-dependent F420 reductase
VIFLIKELNLKIGFISGTGKEGQALAIRFGLSEHSIFIGSRDISKAELSGNQIRNILPDVEILCSDYKQTVLQSDIVFIALPFSVVENQLTPLKNELKGKYIVDTTVPLSLNKGKFTRLSGLKESVSQFLYNLLPDSHIISSFHTLSHLDLKRIQKNMDHDLLYFVNDKKPESKFLELIDTVKGLNPVKCGTLDLSILIEHQVPLLLNINKQYGKSTSLKIQGL